MWTDKIQIEKIDKWLSSRKKRIPSGNRDPFTSSMRSACRFISALSGTAESRETQLFSDLTSAQLFDRVNNAKTSLALSLLNRCKQLAIPADDELSIILILFLEALRLNNEYYKSIIRFWYGVSKMISISKLSLNISVSYILSYFSVADNDNGYIPLNDIISEFSHTEMSSISVSELANLTISNDAKLAVTKLSEAINGYTTRSSRTEMFQALDIMFSFDKAATIERIRPIGTNPNAHKLLKSIISLYSGYFSFSCVLFESNFFKLSLNRKELMNYPLQQIYYGAPGTGKSHATNEVTSKYPDTVRTTFHPDSDYSTFVGAYKPTMEEVDVQTVPVVVAGGITLEQNKGTYKEKKIAYRFVKQAFLKAYVKAWKLFKDTFVEGGELAPQFLVIEEINRGNCAQIFGDLFQLLDRKKNFSEYPVEADADICKALLEEDMCNNPSFGVDGLQLSDEQKAYINSIFDKEGEISQQVAEKICKGEVLVLPPNLYIWATMNTSDQSLFPIDSAFKRRWAWKYVRISEGKNKDNQPLGYRIQFTTLEGEKVDESWWDFINAINVRIEDATKSEDKKLGYFFCKPDKKVEGASEDDNNTIISAETFVGKVVFYLWQDVFKDYGFKSDIFKKDDGKRLAFHDFYPDSIESDEVKNPEAIDLKLVKRFIERVMNKKALATTSAPVAGSAE